MNDHQRLFALARDGSREAGEQLAREFAGDIREGVRERTRSAEEAERVVNTVIARVGRIAEDHRFTQGTISSFRALLAYLIRLEVYRQWTGPGSLDQAAAEAPALGASVEPEVAPRREEAMPQWMFGVGRREAAAE